MFVNLAVPIDQQGTFPISGRDQKLNPDFKHKLLLSNETRSNCLYAITKRERERDQDRQLEEERIRQREKWREREKGRQTERERKGDRQRERERGGKREKEMEIKRVKERV